MFDFYHTPGETNDHLTVWVASKSLLMPGDNIYRSFPNLYTVRGAPSRDSYRWYKSVEFLRSFAAERLVPSHGIPWLSRDPADHVLTVLRDAIQFVHDQTLRAMNSGLLGVDEVVARVRLPEHLSAEKTLQQLYGRVDWSVKGVYDTYVGWFDGRIERLIPLDASKKASLMLELLGDNEGGRSVIEKLIAHAKAALLDWKGSESQGDESAVDRIKWGLELSSLAAFANETTPEQAEELSDISRYLMQSLMSVYGENMIANNFYYSHLTGMDSAEINALNPIKNLPLEQVFHVIPLRFKAELCEPHLRLSLLVEVSSGGSGRQQQQRHGYIIRNCIVEHVENVRGDDTFDVAVDLPEDVFRALISGEIGSDDLFSYDFVRFGSITLLEHFLKFLD